MNLGRFSKDTGSEHQRCNSCKSENSCFITQKTKVEDCVLHWKEAPGKCRRETENGKKDIQEKVLMAHENVFADCENTFMYGGQKRLKAEDIWDYTRERIHWFFPLFVDLVALPGQKIAECGICQIENTTISTRPGKTQFILDNRAVASIMCRFT